MSRIRYNLTPLSPSNIISGALCVIINTPYNSTPDTDGVHYVYNISRSASAQINDGSNYFKGAGICNYKSPYYYITINSITYSFDATGTGVSSNASGYYLVQGTVVNSTTAVGTVISTNTSANQSATGTEQGATKAGTSQDPITYADTSVEYFDVSTSRNVVVNQLNARDEFANAALRGMLSHIENPSALSKNEMFYMCDMAYKWAENMMTVAANARASHSGQNDANMNDLVNAISTSGQADITLNTVSPMKVNGGNSYQTSGGSGTFNLTIADGYEIPQSSTLIKTTNFDSAIQDYLNNTATLNALHDVTITSPQAGDVLKYNNGNWVNGTFNLNDSGTFWGNNWTSGGSINGNITMGASTSKIYSYSNTDVKHIVEWNSSTNYEDVVLGNMTNTTDVAHRTYIDGTQINLRSRNAEDTTINTILSTDKVGITAFKLKNSVGLQVYIGTTDSSVGSQTVNDYKTFLTTNPSTLAIGHGTRPYLKTDIFGKFITFGISNGDLSDEAPLTVMTVAANQCVGIGTGTPTEKLHVNGDLRIGGCKLVWDSSNNLLKVVHATNSGTPVNLSATGGLTAFGPSASSGGKFYFTSTQYLFVENNTLKFYNNGTVSTVNLTASS